MKTTKRMKEAIAGQIGAVAAMFNEMAEAEETKPGKSGAKVRKAVKVKVELAPMPVIKIECKTGEAIKRTHGKPCSLACLAELVGVDGFSCFVNWRALYNEAGQLQLVEPMSEEMMEDEVCLADILKDGRRAAAGKVSNLIKACIAHAGEAALEAECQKWQHGAIAGYTKGNPERLAGQLLAYGIDSSAPGFMLRTPKEWTRAGYELKESARPIFAFTPLFSDKDKKKAEKDGAAIVTTADEKESAPEQTEKKRRHYAIHALFSSEDALQVRTIKRRVRKDATPDDIAGAVAAYQASKPKPDAPISSLADNGPAPTPEVAYKEADLMQLALSL